MHINTGAMYRGVTLKFIENDSNLIQIHWKALKIIANLKDTIFHALHKKSAILFKKFNKTKLEKHFTARPQHEKALKKQDNAEFKVFDAQKAINMMIFMKKIKTSEIKIDDKDILDGVEHNDRNAIFTDFVAEGLLKGGRDDIQIMK